MYVLLGLLDSHYCCFWGIIIETRKGEGKKEFGVCQVVWRWSLPTLRQCVGVSIGGTVHSNEQRKWVQKTTKNVAMLSMPNRRSWWGLYAIKNRFQNKKEMGRKNDICCSRQSWYLLGLASIGREFYSTISVLRLGAPACQTCMIIQHLFGERYRVVRGAICGRWPRRLLILLVQRV